MNNFSHKFEGIFTILTQALFKESWELGTRYLTTLTDMPLFLPATFLLISPLE